MTKRILFIAVAMMISSVLSACNTFHGFGEDVQHLGGAISNAAS
ncbi:entericidin A/B family lipoprotein [Erwinia mallotivora]